MQRIILKWKHSPLLLSKSKNIYHQREIVILPKDEYAEMEKTRHNAAYTEKLQNSIKEFAELRVMKHE